MLSIRSLAPKKEDASSARSTVMEESDVYMADERAGQVPLFRHVRVAGVFPMPIYGCTPRPQPVVVYTVLRTLQPAEFEIYIYIYNYISIVTSAVGKRSVTLNAAIFVIVM